MDYEDVKKMFEGRNYELIESEYKNDKKKMRYKCLIHPEKILQITYEKFRSGQRGCSLNLQLFKVQVGAFGEKSNADRLAKELKA